MKLLTTVSIDLRYSVLIIVFMIMAMPGHAQLKVHAIFDNNMVLQRDKPVKVWGWANPGRVVRVEFSGQDKTTGVEEDGGWQVMLDPMPACSDPGLFKVTSEGEAVVYQNVLVGDLWLLTGQSNMELDLQRIFHGDEEVASAHFSNIRLMTIPAKASPVPLQDFDRLNEWDDWNGRFDLKGYWLVCSPSTVPTFSAIGYIFGRRIHMTTQVPVGLIDASWGGTTVEAWIPRKALEESVINLPLLALWDARNKPDDRNNPGASFNGMMGVFGGLTVKGFIFHQGYNNALGDARPNLYEKNLQLMIQEWRRVFRDAALPFGIIELSAGGEPQTLDNFWVQMMDPAPYIREGQLKAYLELSKTGFVSAYDEQVNWYHPFKKLELGERMARWALGSEYGYDFGWKPAVPVSWEVTGKSLTVTFDKEVITHDGRPIEGMALAGKDHRFYPADASYVVSGKDDRGRDVTDRLRVVIQSHLVPKPVAARYAWARNPLGNLVNGQHMERVLAVPPFRTDDWDWPEAPYKENNDPEFQAHRKVLQDMKKKK